MELTKKLSDEEILRGLNANPQIKNRIPSLMGEVEDKGGDLRLAAAAKARLIEEMRQMVHEAMQAWAERQAQKCEQEVRQNGQVHREGKNSGGTAPLAISALTSGNTATGEIDHVKLALATPSVVAAWMLDSASCARFECWRSSCLYLPLESRMNLICKRASLSVTRTLF